MPCSARFQSIVRALVERARPLPYAHRPHDHASPVPRTLRAADLSDPLAVFGEIRRVLKPGGQAVFTWSNRMFPTKAIAAWRLASEPARLWICGSYFHYAGGFTPPEGADISPYPGRSDPVYVVSARRKGGPNDDVMPTATSGPSSLAASPGSAASVMAGKAEL